MRKKRELFRAMLKIGIVGFGGGSALIPVIEEEFVKQNDALQEDDYNKEVVVASTTPGALPVEIASGVGYQLQGIFGMLSSATAMAFPGALITIVMLLLLSKVNESVLMQIQFLSIGITIFIILLLTDYIKGSYSALDLPRGKLIVSALIFGVFFLTSGAEVSALLGIERTPVFDISTIQVLGTAFFVIFYTRCRFRLSNVLITFIVGGIYLLCAGKAQVIANDIIFWGTKGTMLALSLYGLYQSFYYDKKTLKINVKPLLYQEIAWIVYFLALSAPVFICLKQIGVSYLLKGAASTIVSFGGGDAYLTVADNLFVQSGLISNQEFYNQLVPIINVLPGSILCKALTGIGYYVGLKATDHTLLGILTGVSGLACSVAVSCFVFTFVRGIYDSVENLEVFLLIKKWIRPITSGLMMNVILSMVSSNLQIGEEYGWISSKIILLSIGIYMINAWMFYIKKYPKFGTILVSGGIAILVCNIFNI